MAVILFIIMLVFAILYAILIENYRRWFLQVKPFQSTVPVDFSISFSVIIPARNEAASISQTLLSVLQQQYDSAMFEVIVVDDFSTDDTAVLVQQLQQDYPNLTLIRLQDHLHTRLNSYKKKAIALAIAQAKGDYIITTDADCQVQPLWLQQYASIIQQKGSIFIAAPVAYINDGSFVSIFQCLDFLSLQGITIAAVHAGFHAMCNGANLAYTKAVFYEVGGFEGIDKIASGDDMMLMHKIYKQHPTSVHFLASESAIVRTAPMPTWGAFFNQRIRWASKADQFRDKRIFWVLVFVYLLNVSLFILPLLSFWYGYAMGYWIIMLGVKTIIELRLMLPVARFFKQQNLLWWFPAMQPFHIFYTVIAGWLGKFGTYTWKGRTVK